MAPLSPPQQCHPLTGQCISTGDNGVRRALCMDAMGEERGQHLPLQPPNGCSCGVGEGGREALKTPKEHPPKNTELWQPHTLPHLKQHPDPLNGTRCSPQCWMQPPYPPHIKMGWMPPCSPPKIIRTSRARCIPVPSVYQMPTPLISSPPLMHWMHPMPTPGPDADQGQVPPGVGQDPPNSP